MSNQIIHLEVNPLKVNSFFYTFIYADFNASIRRLLLKKLSDIVVNNLPWLVLGDFNCLADIDECTGHKVRLRFILGSSISPS